jgi:hypothetical protein
MRWGKQNRVIDRHWRAACFIGTRHPVTRSRNMSTHPTNSTASSNDQIPADLLQLAREIHQLPEAYASRLAPLVDAVVESTKRRRRILSLVQDALSQLRLDMKYLMFDLEATRRERDEYRLKLEE